MLQVREGFIWQLLLMQNPPGLDDLDPAAAFLAREQEQLGELEEEIGSLSGARFFCFFRISYFGHCQHLGHCHHHHDRHLSLNGSDSGISNELSWSRNRAQEGERGELSQLFLLLLIVMVMVIVIVTVIVVAIFMVAIFVFFLFVILIIVIIMMPVDNRSQQ